MAEPTGKLQDLVGRNVNVTWASNHHNRFWSFNCYGVDLPMILLHPRYESGVFKNTYSWGRPEWWNLAEFARLSDAGPAVEEI
jgi:hypothetical protein